MSKKDAHLYGIKPPPKKASSKDISSSTTLAFTSQLSSLLAASSSSNDLGPSRGRSRPSHSKPSIFTSHNKNTKKRALRDLEDEDADHAIQKHKTSDSLGLDPTDPATLHRAKRKMEEKARLYAAMKRGDYVPPEGSGALDPLIDFDRKWAEKQAAGKGDEDTSSDDGADSDYDDMTAGQQNEIIEYEDEFGRVRRGTVADKNRQERKMRRQLLGAEELDRLTARPAAPENLIHGDTIQSSAYAPDDETTTKMEELAAKRDRSATPPPATHYAADSEIRNRGTGFYTFSKDESVREKEMEELERERKETERVRREREEKKRKRMAEVEERKREIARRRAGREADKFLEELGGGGGLEESADGVEKEKES